MTENQFGYLPQPGGTVDPWNLARDGLAAEWKPWIDKGVLIIALKDNPRMGSDVIACTAAHPDSADSRCSAVPGSAVSARDPLLEAAAGTGSRVIDFSDIYCPDRCLPVIGRVLVYRSPDQLTRTWVLTVAPLLQQRIERVLSDATATRG